MQARLISDYRAAYPHPIRIAAGERVALGVRDEEWPAFVWITGTAGSAGWAPLAWLQPTGDGHAVAMRDYDARELDAAQGDTVVLHHEYGDWWWAERADGTQGWLPARDLELLEETT
ncbi:SH3 domain-containing protein [Xanthomonas sacchari]|uniref:Peptide-binding protein n=2 Tax=Xanthomonas TaxID=338 RepID=A0A6N7QPB0_9XANT|nr:MULTISPECIES: SH3 domain-containing protein [Xanthomonas]AJC46966.1 peptide-binding protein [Xanthomonas sacchari]KAA8920670.1 peptide-binding protein [Xanthomonas sontii]KAB7762715.1 peptide-binding protein [Xanthomonas sp. LMG 12462]KAB7763035.1 peptide-binding protein [Xanthomonas sp. LMG 12461]KAB7781251.1 peptide-binding protein [Xanthomonas sp. LMG 12459]